MSKVKVDEIESSSGGGLTAKITNNLSNRNSIINGAMQVAQRGTSSTTDGYGSVDRFNVKSSGADEAPTHAQVDVASGTTPYTLGFRKALKITNGNQTSGAGAADWMEIGYKIEAQDTANSGWNYLSTSSYITLSYWVKSSVAQTFYGYMFNRDGTIRSYPWSTGSLSADTWTKVTKTIPGYTGLQFDNNNGAGLEIYFPLFNGTDMTNNSRSLNTWATHDGAAQTPDQTSTWWTTNDATFEITGVQLEVSDYATDFEHRSYADELRRCQRYFERVGGELGYDAIANGMQRTTSQSLFQLSFKVPKRAAPTVTLTGDVITTDRYAFDETITGLDAAIASKTGLHGRATHSSVGAERRPIFLSSKNGTPYGYISFDAEL